MTIEITLRVVSLILIASLGWILGKKLNVKSGDISSLLIYAISPFTILVAILQSPADWTYFGYSVGALATATIAAFLAYIIGRCIWNDGRVNLFSFSGGTGNTGYFALPLVFSLFNEKQTAIAIFIIIGVNIYEFTVGYFITAKGISSTKESLLKITKLPIIYAAAIGIALKMLNIYSGEIFISTLTNFKGAYSVLGMMVIGITLSSYRNLKIDWTFTSLSIGWKHFVFPAVGIATFYFLLNGKDSSLPVIALMLATPMAGNVVVISNNLNLHPEKAALSVMISTIFSVITIPLTLLIVMNII